MQRPDQKQPKSTIFKFVLSTQQILTNLDSLKLNNYDRFKNLSKLGKQILQLSKSNQHQALDTLFGKNMLQIPLLKLQIEDAFISAFNFNNYETIKYYLENGLDIQSIMEDSVVNLCYSLQYLFHDPPIEMLQVILQYGADPRIAESKESQTGLHIAAKTGCLVFVKLLLKYGGDINAIDDNKKTPLGYALESKKTKVIEFLKQNKAQQNWK